MKFSIPFNGDVEIGDVVEAEVDELLQLFLAEVVLDGARVNQLAVVVTDESVLAERVVDKVED